MKIDCFGSYGHTREIVVETKAEELDISFDDFQFSAPVNVKCLCNGEGELVRISAVVRTTLRVACSRCLVEYDEQIEGDFDLVVRKLKDGEVVRDSEATTDDDDDPQLVVVDSATNEVEIGSFVHDALILALPIKPLCSEDCRGLCSVCGVNLNESRCDCYDKNVDGRWKGLDNLFKK